ncbi:bestrophin family ion channel, partial [Klebsiella pneumoniae]
HDDAEAGRWLVDREWRQIQALPLEQRCDALMMSMGHDLAQCVRRGEMEPCLAASMDKTFTRMTAAAASCERIRNTPMPFSYALLLHRTAY